MDLITCSHLLFSWDCWLSWEHLLWPALTPHRFPWLRLQEGLNFRSKSCLLTWDNKLFINANTDKCRWNFLHSAEAIRKQEFSDTLPRASVQDLGVILMGAGYEVVIFIVDSLLPDP